MRALLAAAVLASTLALPAQAATGFRSPWPAVTCAADPRLTAADASGVYSPTSHTIVLAPYVCSDLAALQHGASITDMRAESVITLAHELAHASGITDEQQAEAHARQITPDVARHIGLKPWQTRDLVAFVRSLV